MKLKETFINYIKYSGVRLRKKTALHNEELSYLRKFVGEQIGFYNGEKMLRILTIDESTKLLSNKINSGLPFMSGRYGGTELRAILSDKKNEKKHIKMLCIEAGFFPNDIKYLSKFREVLAQAEEAMDIVAPCVYRNEPLQKSEHLMLQRLPNVQNLVHTDALGKFIVQNLELSFKERINNSWIPALKNKKVLVITSMAETIKSQYLKLTKQDLLPKFSELLVIKSVNTVGGKNDEFETWFEALAYLESQIKEIDFDVAILGCGAYGMPLCAYIKSLNKQSIYIGGYVQLLFAIRGKRWDDQGYDYSANFWVYPFEEDKPKNYKKVEGGCYW